jgi:hypothetical protein
MAKPDRTRNLERAFSEAEASLLLEGLRPTEFGNSLKDRLLSGEINLAEAEAEFRAHYLPADSAVA